MAEFSKEFLDHLDKFERDFYMMSEEDVCPNCDRAGGIDFFERKVSAELTENTGWTKEQGFTCHACDYDVTDNT